MSARCRILSVLAGALFLSACTHSNPPSRFAVVRADRQITAPSKYPVAVDPSRVGTYPPDTGSGAGYFYDEVLEYRVWCNPANGAEPLNGRSDYYVAFAQYEAADAFSKKTPGTEAPLVLVRQLEWISEPNRGHFIPEKGERITEWQIAWLKGNKRTNESIREFMQHPREEGP